MKSLVLMTVIQGHYQPSLVALSFLIAVIASYTALDLTGRVTPQSPQKKRLLWALGGSLAMGTGIWSMHFIGMLAFKLPQTVTYNIKITFLSWGVGVITSGLGLLLWSQPKLNLGVLSSGAVLGLAIASMHYLGMAGMMIPGTLMQYDLRGVLVSVTIAIFASMVALGLTFYLRNFGGSGFNPLKVCSAVVMAIAISGMHYTGMWATRIQELSSVPLTSTQTFSNFELALQIAVISLILLLAALVASIFDQRYSNQLVRQEALREKGLAKAIQRMRQTLDLKTIFDTTTSELREVINCDRVVLYRFRPDWSGEFIAESVNAGWIFLFEEQNYNPKLQENSVSNERCTVKSFESNSSTYYLSPLISDTYFQNTQGELYSQGVNYRAVPDIYQAEFDNCYIKLLESFQARAYIIVPIFSNNQLWGLLATYQNSSPRHWKQAEINIAVQISHQLGIALQQAELLEKTQKQSIALQAAVSAADAANRAKSEFLATMSHELRTPLNAILGFTQLMNEDPLLSSKHHKYINIINQEGEHLLTLINDILEMSKIEAGSTTLNEHQFDLIDFLESIIKMWQMRAESKGLELKFQYAPDLPRYLQADEGKLRQVLLNLLSNAIKFTSQGQVRLRVKREYQICQPELPVNNLEDQNRENPAISASTDQKLELILFEIEDTGLGIAPEEIPLLFEPFKQTESGRNSHQGTGLGLAISRKYIQLMGGDIHVRSQLGVGSLFMFEIPIHSVKCCELSLNITKPKAIRCRIYLLILIQLSHLQESD